MSIQIFNSLTRQKEPFVPLEEGKVKMYVCGPTVYNYIHIGNSRPVIVYDTVRRYFQYAGYDVKFVSNFTDVDDKIIKAANELGEEVSELTERFIAAYFDDITALGCKKADAHPRVTDHMDDIIEFIKVLIDKGYAYESQGDVYYRTRKFDGYGKLSHQSIDDLQVGARIEVGEKKEDPLDFALWKAAKPGEIFWASPWGNGRPGWHIECSVMAREHLGDTIDIHAGGQDLTFPHHENEIAQSEGAFGVPFCRFWIQNGFINVDNKKMSKSAGNFFLVRDAAGKYGYKAVRFFLLSSHYRSPINYSDDILSQASAAVERLDNCLGNIEFAAKNASGEITEREKESIALLEAKKSSFVEAMEDDLNTADAIGYLFEMTRDINTVISSGASVEYIDAVTNIYIPLCELLGFGRETDDVDVEYIEEMIAKRAEAKKAKDFAQADAIRNELLEKGIVLEDTRQGVKWKKA